MKEKKRKKRALPACGKREFCEKVLQGFNRHGVL
jgi:hypothetical protein